MKYEKVKIENGGWMFYLTVGMVEIYIIKTAKKGEKGNGKMENNTNNTG